MNIWQYTYFGTYNEASNVKDLKSCSDIEQILWDNLWKCFILWWWSNVLLKKPLYDDLIFVRNMLHGIQYLWYWYVKVASWELLINLVKWLKESFNSNILNPVFGLPWTVWWAVIWNAWSFGVEMWNFVHTIKYINEEWKVIETRDYNCAYRTSNLKWRKVILLEVVFQFNFEAPYIWQPADYYMNWRNTNHECSKTCWSYFKSNVLNKTQHGKSIEKILAEKDSIINKFHPNWLDGVEDLKIPVGWMIDRCWLRGYSENWVKISEKHWNFIVNYNNTDPCNILSLAQLAKDKVYDKFWVIIEEEVVII